jgi:hypothetical protein
MVNRVGLGGPWGRGFMSEGKYPNAYSIPEPTPEKPPGPPRKGVALRPKPGPTDGRPHRFKAKGSSSHPLEILHRLMAISGTSFCAERTEEVQKTGW